MKIPTLFPADIPYPTAVTKSHLESLSYEDKITAIRLHPYKGLHLQELYKDRVLWDGNGVYLNDRPRFKKEANWLAGAYYVQDSGSMLLKLALDQLEVAPQDQPVVLDLCGAPGGKSTLIAEWLEGNGVLIANEVIKSRAHILLHNLIKSGYSNTIVTSADPNKLGVVKDFVDIVVVDAPCSGEGLWRKDTDAYQEWSPEHVTLCAARQTRILHDIMDVVKPGGYLIYATCTYNFKENIESTRILHESGFETIPISKPPKSNLASVGDGLLAIPGIARSEGQFIACFRKKEKAHIDRLRLKSQTQKLPKSTVDVIQNWLSESHHLHTGVVTKSYVVYTMSELVNTTYQLLARHHIYPIQTGLLAGKLIGNQLIPDHALAMSLDRHQELSTYECTVDQVLLFFDKKLELEPNMPSGWVLLTYMGNGLGWVKCLPNRINNYLPKNW